MAEYKHGAYGHIEANVNRVSAESQSAVVVIGTAPVHMVEGGGENVNVPVMVRNIADAVRKFGYSDDYASYTLCEAMHVFLEVNGVGPLILINVLDPAKHVKSQTATKSLTPENGRVVIVAAQNAVLDSVVVKTGDTTKVKGTDYAISYDIEKKAIFITELSEGSLGTSALTITYKEIDPAAVTEDDVIGESDGYGKNTGVYAVQNVYQLTGYIPSFLMAPGFSSIPAIHNAMLANSKKINGHWDAYMLVDLPIVADDTAITLETVETWKIANGYTNENETVYFPMATGVDGNKYHLSVLAGSNLQVLLAEQEGIPYKTASNTAVPLIENLYLGADSAIRVYDDTLINNTLNKKGIASAAFVGGRWAIWGAHSADYSQENANAINVSETNRMMLFYISNDFQHRRTGDVDKILSANDIMSIVAEEQAKLDALLKIGALTFGEVYNQIGVDDKSDVLNGDFTIEFRVTTSPLMKSLTAKVNWTTDGFVTYFESFMG